MRRISGFTLIELMITVAVIAILAAVAYPSYQDHIRRGVRSQGQQFLMDIAQRQEQFFLDQRQLCDRTRRRRGRTLNRRSAGNCGQVSARRVFIVNTAATPPTFTISHAPRLPPATWRATAR